jgi:CBS domain-containing protein
MKVSDVMSARVVTIAPDMNVADAAKIMKKEDIGSIVIVQGGKPVGIMTREDITNRVAAADKQPSKVHVKDIMTSPVVTVSPEEDIVEAANRMSKYGYERMPVKQLNKLVGFISVRDILRVSPGLLELLREHFTAEEAEETQTDEAQAGECELCGNFSESLHKINDRWVCDTDREEASEL